MLVFRQHTHRTTGASNRTRVVRRWIGRLTVVALLLGTARHLPAAERPGALLFGEEFDRGLDQWSAEQVTGGSVAAKAGALVIEDVGGTTLWFRHRLTAPVVISYEAEVVTSGGPNDRLSDLNCFWMAQDPARPDGSLPAGRSGRFADYDSLLTYYVGYGGNKNTTTRFRRYDGTPERPLLPEHDLRAPQFLLKPNHAYQIKLVVRDGTAEFWRDGEKIFSYADPHPLNGGYFAFRTVRSHLVIRHFKVNAPATSQ